MKQENTDPVPPNDAPSQGAVAQEDIKMEDAPEETAAAKDINLEEELFATDSEDDEFYGEKEKAPDTPTSSNEETKTPPQS